MEKLYENSFIRIEWDNPTSVLFNTWLPDTKNMDSEDYKAAALKQIEYIKEKKTKRWFIDTKELQFALSPTIQEWADAKFPKILEAGVKHIAFVISIDFISQLSVEQLMEERNVINSNFEIRYFADKENAYNWITTTPE